MYVLAAWICQESFRDGSIPRLNVRVISALSSKDCCCGCEYDTFECRATLSLITRETLDGRVSRLDCFVDKSSSRANAPGLRSSVFQLGMRDASCADEHIASKHQSLGCQAKGLYWLMIDCMLLITCRRVFAPHAL